MKKSFNYIYRRIQLIWRRLGPGLITGVSDDDPSGIATYSQAGAGFGLVFLWTAFLSYPLLFAMQEMSARIGIICSNGLAGVIARSYSKSFTYLLMLFVVPAIILNIAADIASMGAVANLLIPSISPLFFDVLFTLMILAGLIFFSYRLIAKIMKYFCLVLICYLIVPFLIKQNFSAIFSATFLPVIKWDQNSLMILVAILGTTISPYLFFWQSSMSYEHKKQLATVVIPSQEIKDMRFDVNAGALISNIAMYFIILTTATVLFPAGNFEINTVEQAAEALKPLAGNMAYLLFSLGIFGVGFLAIPVLASCVGYIFAETFNWKRGLDYSLKEAKEFYIVIATALAFGLLINFFNIDPIQSLIYTAVIYGITAPVVISAILHICNNKNIMGAYTNSSLSNFLGIITFFLMAGIALILVLTMVNNF